MGNNYVLTIIYLEYVGSIFKTFTSKPLADKIF